MSIMIAASGVLSGLTEYRQYVQAQEAILHERVVAVAQRIGAYVEGIEQGLRWTAGSPGTRKMQDPASIRLELLSLLRRVPAVSDASWIDMDGRELASVSRLAPDTIGSRKDFSSEERVVAARRDRFSIGPVYFQEGSEPHVVIAVADEAPGRPVLRADVNLKLVWDVIAGVQIGKTGQAYLVDSRGQLIAHPDISQVLRHTDMTELAQVRAALTSAPPDSPAAVSRAFDLQRVAVLSAWAAVPVAGWTVFAELPRAEAMAPLYAALVRTAILVIAGVIGAVWLSILLSRRLVRPVQALANGARQMGAGEMDRPIAILSGDELEDLAGEFNRMAARIQQTLASLESRVAERTNELRLANEAKTRFLAAASHDLRQPMHALCLYVGRLHATATTPQARQLVAHVETTVAALAGLLDALLDLSKLDAGLVRPRLQPVDLNRLLQQVQTQLTPVAEAKALALKVVATSVWVRSDPLLLERVLLNFASNALRYTRHGRIVIGCRRRGNSIRVDVIDTGAGIAESDLVQVFREFFQAEKAGPDATGGLGLGLAIVDRIARLLEHPISVRSTVGRGSRFSVMMARCEPVLEHASGPLVCSDFLINHQVLVVEDDRQVADALCGLLRDWGYRVVHAPTAADAAQILDELRPIDAVISDLHLANGESGVAVLDLLCRKQHSSPIGILLTADTSPDNLRAAYDSGFPVLHKPVRPAKLRALLEQLLADRESCAS